MSDADRSRTDSLAHALSAERDRLRLYLRGEMEKLGLREEDGWSILEFTRESGGGTQIVLRPMHMRLAPPAGLECVVGIVEDDGKIHGKCTGPDSQPDGAR
jgi:hypothetical protein